MGLQSSRAQSRTLYISPCFVTRSSPPPPQCALLGGLLFDPTTSLVTGGPQPFELIMFVFLYLLGLSLLVASTLFWESPMTQCRNMLKGGKIFATIIFMLTAALLVVVVVIPAASKVEAVFKVPAMCALMVIQAIVFVWYLLATIPSAYCALRAPSPRRSGASRGPFLCRGGLCDARCVLSVLRGSVARSLGALFLSPALTRTTSAHAHCCFPPHLPPQQLRGRSFAKA